MKVKTQEIVERARGLSRSNLLFIFGIIKAASIGVAVTVFLQIFIDLGPDWHWQSIWSHIPSFFQWGVSYLCLVVTYDAAMFSTIFLIHIPKKSESFFTFLLVGTESLQFAILSPQIHTYYGYDTIMSVVIEDWWYAIVFFYLLFMYCVVYFGKIKIERSKGYAEKELQKIINYYLKSFFFVKWFIAISLLSSLLIFAILIYLTIDNYYYRYHVRLISSIFYLFLVFFVFFGQHKKRSEIENSLKKL